MLEHIDANGVRAAGLPVLAGVSREAISMALGLLTREGYAAVAVPAGSRHRVVALNARGSRAQRTFRERVQAVEASWVEQFGAAPVERLRSAAERIAGGAGTNAALLAGIEPAPSNWRAALARPTVLPDFPMTLHRGGYPDGS